MPLLYTVYILYSCVYTVTLIIDNISRIYREKTTTEGDNVYVHAILTLTRGESAGESITVAFI